MKKNQVNFQKWSTSTNVKAPWLRRWQCRLFYAFFLVFVTITNLSLPVYAASDPHDVEQHSFKKYYNDYVGKYLDTDYCQTCGCTFIHYCLYPLRFMTVGKTYSYTAPWVSSQSKLLTNYARHNVNVTGRVRNQDGELWLLLSDGTYISADSVAFNFDYYAEEAVHSASIWVEPRIGMFMIYAFKKDYDMKEDKLLGLTYPYKLYSAGTFLSGRYSGEQIGNMIYGYVSAAKGLSYIEASKWADLTSKEGKDSLEDKHSILLGYNYRKNGAWFEEVSDRYIGKTVAIKSVEVSKYVSSDTDQNRKGINAAANRDSARTWELFTVETGEAGAVGFRSNGNGNYLSARIDENEEYAYVQAAFGYDYSKPQSWESFRIFEWNDVQYIQSQANGKWVQVSVNESDYPIKAAADAPSTWERFQLEIVNGDSTTSNNITSGVTESSTETSAGKDYSSKNVSASTTVSRHYWSSDYNEGWYEGEWSNDKPNGYGKLTYDDFEDGKYYCLLVGSAEYKALYYEGNFCDGWREGTGKVIYEDGWIQEGSYYGKWVAGKIVFEGRLWHGMYYLDGYQTATSSVDCQWTWLTTEWQLAN